VSRFVPSEPEETQKTALGERRIVQLRDGTRIHLNTATSVTTNVAHHVREVTLESGEILIDNTAPEAAPIRITTNGVAVNVQRGRLTARLVLHDEYVMRTYDGLVTLVSMHSQNRWELQQGRAVTIRPGRAIVSRFDLQDGLRMLGWTEGRLIFEGTSLSEAVAEFNRYNPLKMEIGDPSLACLPIGGSFEATDVDGFVRAASALLKVDVVWAQRGASKVLVLKRPGWEGNRRDTKTQVSAAEKCDGPRRAR